MLSPPPLPRHMCSQCKAIILTHEGSEVTDADCYLSQKLRPLRPILCYGRRTNAKPPPFPVASRSEPFHAKDCRQRCGGCASVEEFLSVTPFSAISLQALGSSRALLFPRRVFASVCLEVFRSRHRPWTFGRTLEEILLQRGLSVSRKHV